MVLTLSEAESRAQRSGWRFPSSCWALLSPYEREFLDLELSQDRSLSLFEHRLRRIGFDNLGHLLDAGCGVGQWSVAMVKQGNRVTGIDVNQGRLFTARRLAEVNEVSDACGFQYGSTSQCPFEDASFDGIFCYGVFMFTDMPATLREFKRVLKPGGRVYLNANSTGWYAHLTLDRGLKKKNRSMVRSGLSGFVRGAVGRTSARAVTEGWLREEIAKAGFRVLGFGPEGHVTTLDDSPPCPLYPESFYGMPAIHEALLEG